MAELKFAPEQIDAAGKGLQGVAADAHGDLAAFESELAGHGQPWGRTLNDPIGPLIGIAYMAVSSVALACYRGNINALHRHGVATQATAAGYRDSESASTAAVKQIHNKL